MVAHYGMKCQDIFKNNEVCRKPYGSREVQFGIRKMCGLFSFISVSAPPRGGGCLFKPVSYVSYKFSSISTKRFPSALSYFLAINPLFAVAAPRASPYQPRRGSRSRSVLHISFVPGRTPRGWARPGFVLPELQGRWPVARKLKLTVKNTHLRRRWRSRLVEREDGGYARSIYAANIPERLYTTTSSIKRKQLFLV